MANAPGGVGALAKTTETGTSPPSLTVATHIPEHPCRRCGRPLRSALAVAAQLGATCAMRQAAEWWQPPLDFEAVGHE